MQSFKKYVLLLCLTFLLPVVCTAGEQAASDVDQHAHYNLPLLSMVGVMVVLLFIAGLLAAVVGQLAIVVKDKMRKEKKDTVVTKVLLLALLLLPALNSRAAETVAAASADVQYLSGVSNGDFYLIVLMIGFELLIIFFLAIYATILLKVIKGSPELKAKIVAKASNSWFWTTFNMAATIETEKDILLDHDYDGIKELDNSLPPWWKYGFILTIFIAVIYLYRFHVSHDGKNPQEELAVEMQKADEDKAAYLATAANNIDESNVVRLTDINELSAGKEIFEKNCSPCHVTDGGGNVGPNLTDDYWLHGGGMKDVFKSIKYGWQDKGMKSWKDDLSPKQIQEVASYVKSLHGTHPAVPKSPQGDLYIESENIKPDSAKGLKVAVN